MRSDDPMYLFDAEEFEWMEIGHMGMVMVDNGPSFIRYRYGRRGSRTCTSIPRTGITR